MALADCQILGNPEMLHAIRLDIREANPIYVFAFKIQPQFFSELFAEYVDKYPVYIVANHSEARALRLLSREFPNLHAYSWSENRLFHSKVYIFPKAGVAYVGSHNMTKYAFTSGINHSVRIHNRHLVDQLSAVFVKAQKTARELTGDLPHNLIA